jgi:hypothetical protein
MVTTIEYSRGEKEEEKKKKKKGREEKKKKRRKKKEITLYQAYRRNQAQCADSHGSKNEQVL